MKTKQTEKNPHNSRRRLLFLALLVVNLLLAVPLVVSRYDSGQASTARGQSQPMDLGWLMQRGGGWEERSLPVLSEDGGSLLVLAHEIPSGASGLSLNINAVNAALRVYAGDTLLYESGYIYRGDGSVAAVIGSGENTIALPDMTGESADGQANTEWLRLELEQANNFRPFGLRSVESGGGATFLKYTFRRSIVSFLCTVLICSSILVVLVIHFVGVCVRQRHLAHLACMVYGMFLALHVASQIGVLQTIYGNQALFVRASSVSLSFLPPLLTAFYRELFGSGRGARAMDWLLGVNLTLTLLENAALLVFGSYSMVLLRAVIFITLALSATAALGVFLLRRLYRTPEGRVRIISLLVLLTTVCLQTYRQSVSGRAAELGSLWVVGMTLYYALTSVIGVVTELASHNNVIRASEQKAIAANKAKSAFLANMSHEIRTPINAILGMDEMILRESGDAETLSRAGDIRSAGRTLLSLVNDILDFSKIEEGKMDILPTQYELSSLVNDLVNMVRERAEKKGLRLIIQVDENTPYLLHGDEIRIRQCALNVLTNAVKYTEKGSVTLEIGYEKLSDQSISLRFRVTDTGIGMKQEDLDKLFSPFDRIEEKRNRSIEGTGLGMSITQQLLELMGSRLEVESVYGEGSTFTFAVEQPVVKWNPVGTFTGRFESETQQTYHEQFHAPDARVLVVDDTPVNLTVVKGLLKRTQIQVDTAESGAEAVRLAAQRRYDVIFIDHMMPVMDGMETLQALKQLPNMEHTVFVALTANAISGARELYLEAGFADYLSKPVDGGRLEKLLQRHLPPEKVHEPVQETIAPARTIPTVLVVDDDPLITSLAGSILSKSCQVIPCQDGERAAAEAERLRPDLILLDINLGELTGFDVLRSLRARSATRDTPVVFLTGERNEEAEIEGFRNGASDFVRKPFVPEVLVQRTRRIIELDRLQHNLANEVRRQTLRAGRLSKEMMLALSKAVDAKDHYTNGHSQRVAAYAAEIARRMGKSAQEQEQIYAMGLMHDIGKIGVPEEIINKTSRLTDEEFAKIKRHTVIGSEILSLISEMPALSAGARWHHEKYDGSGYPDGLKGQDIPEPARIICLADCYDAMTSTRTYSAPKPQAVVRAEFERCSGTQFDPALVRFLLEMIDEDADYRMNEQTADIRVWKESDKLWSSSEEIGEAGGMAAGEPDSGANAPGDGTDAPPELPAWLYEVGELDVTGGLRHCGTEETYLETLKIFGSSAAASADEIDAYWRAGDLANTTIKVHALKSTSRAIGAEELGAVAERLELAGKAGDTQTLSDELPGLVARFRALGEQLSPLYASPEAADTGKPEIPPEQLQEAYAAISELSESLDYDSIAYVIASLDEWRIPEQEKERVANLRDAAENFDWERVGALVQNE